MPWRDRDPTRPHPFLIERSKRVRRGGRRGEPPGSDLPRILLVEDDPDEARLLAEELEEAWVDGRLAVVADGESALRYLRRQGRYCGAARPNLVLLDLTLPGMDGYAVLREVKRDPALRSIPIVVLSGQEAPEGVREAYRDGAATYLKKPDRAAGYREVAELLAFYWFLLARVPCRGGG